MFAVSNKCSRLAQQMLYGSIWLHFWQFTKQNKAVSIKPNQAVM